MVLNVKTTTTTLPRVNSANQGGGEEARRFIFLHNVSIQNLFVGHSNNDRLRFSEIEKRPRLGGVDAPENPKCSASNTHTFTIRAPVARLAVTPRALGNETREKFQANACVPVLPGAQSIAMCALCPIPSPSLLRSVSSITSTCVELADPPRTPPLLANGSIVGTRRLVVPDKETRWSLWGYFVVVARLKVFSWKLQ